MTVIRYTVAEWDELLNPGAFPTVLAIVELVDARRDRSGLGLPHPDLKTWWIEFPLRWFKPAVRSSSVAGCSRGLGP